MTKDAGKRRTYQGIEARLTAAAGQNGFVDINDFIDSLMIAVTKLQDQNKALQERIKELSPLEDKAMADILGATVPIKDGQ